MLWLLDNPTHECLAGIDVERLNAKLEGLEEFRQDIANWNALQDVISAGVTLVAQVGLRQGIGLEFMQQVAALPGSSSTLENSSTEKSGATADSPAIDREQVAGAVARVSQKLQEFLTSQETHLKPGERLPLCTEILESSFGLYKQLEGQHSKHGFSGLLGAFGCILGPLSEAKLAECLTRVGVKEM